MYAFLPKVCVQVSCACNFNNCTQAQSLYSLEAFFHSCNVLLVTENYKDVCVELMYIISSHGHKEAKQCRC